MDENRLSLVFSIDIVFDNPYTIKNGGKENLQFLKEISNILNENISNFCNPKISWLVSDNESILEEFFNRKDSFVTNSDEIGMHNLISNYLNLKNSKKEEIKNYVENAINLFEKFSIKPISNRTMGCTASNDLFSILSDFGFNVDSSSIPNRKRTKKIEFDWNDTPSNPYYPSTSDYRIPGESIPNSQKILEVPLSTMLTKTSYDDSAIIRYIDLCFNKNIISKNLKDVVLKNEYLIMIIHPHELLQNPKKHELYAKNISEFSENMKRFGEILDSLNRKISCFTLSEMPDLVKNTTN